MLASKERKIMQAIYSLAKDKNSLLLSPVDIINNTKAKEITVSDVEKTVIDLSQDKYFDFVFSDRHGERVYCITLLEKGKNFERSQTQLKRTIIFRVCLTISLAILSFVTGLILKAIF